MDVHSASNMASGGHVAQLRFECLRARGALGLSTSRLSHDLGCYTSKSNPLALVGCVLR